MKIKFMLDKFVDDLKNNIHKNIKKYENPQNEWIKKEWLKEFKKEFPEFELDTSKENPSDTDLNNIMAFYSGLKELSDGQACDERLWVGLCHDKFWKYVQYRWPIKNKESMEKEDYVKRHYFLAHGQIRSLMTNSLARLWWYGRLTYDEDAKDPFILTKYLCKDLNGRGFMLFGSNFSNNKELTKKLLYILMEYEEKNNLSREDFEAVRKRMNLWGGKIILDSLTKEELAKKIFYFLEELKKSKN